MLPPKQISCLQSVGEFCGSIGSVPKDAEVPTNFCKKCQGGFTVNDPAKQNVSAAQFGVALEACPDRKQRDIPKINDGCTATPYNYIFAALGIYESFDPNNPTGEINTVFGNFVSSDNTKPCGAHDFGYETCKKDKSLTDGEFLTAMGAVCAAVPADQTMIKFSLLHPLIPVVKVRTACTVNAILYFEAVSIRGATAYDNAQKAYCDCCGK